VYTLPSGPTARARISALAQVALPIGKAVSFPSVSLKTCGTCGAEPAFPAAHSPM